MLWRRTSTADCVQWWHVIQTEMGICSDFVCECRLLDVRHRLLNGDTLQTKSLTKLESRSGVVVVDQTRSPVAVWTLE